MNIRKYRYEYAWGDAWAHIKIDTRQMTAERCEELIMPFSIDRLEDCPYDELGRLYCRHAIKCATLLQQDSEGVIYALGQSTKLAKCDGSQGITLMGVQGLDFSDIELDRTI